MATFTKRLLKKVKHQNDKEHERSPSSNLGTHVEESGKHSPTNLDAHIVLHYGVPSTASILAFDSIQRLLAIGTLDGRIKVIGGNNIEGLLTSPKKVPYKNLEFFENKGYVVGISNENEIEIWSLENRTQSCCLQWESNVTAFAIVQGTYLMYIGDEHGMLSVLKYDASEGKLSQLPYQIPPDIVTEAVGISSISHQSIVGILPQPLTCGNRVLIAYEGGLIILWDFSETRVASFRGSSGLKFKGYGASSTESCVKHQGHSSEYLEEDEEEGKEICSMCWVSSNGSVVAVGYTDGDILLWNIASPTNAPQPGMSADGIIKLQLCDSDKRLPVIILRWFENHISNHNHRGQLFIYGGDEIGSNEVLTVLNIEWASGIETLRCKSQLGLPLKGFFADLVLIPSAGARVHNHSPAAIFILTNPGHLDIYDGANFSEEMSQEVTSSINPEQYPTAISTVDPYMIVAKLVSFPKNGPSFKTLAETALALKKETAQIVIPNKKWALTGGVSSDLSFGDNVWIQRMFLAGYGDGTIRIWDATYPILSPMFFFKAEVETASVHGGGISELEFCFKTLQLAAGFDTGLVLVFLLREASGEMDFHVVTDSKKEVHVLRHGIGYHSMAAFTFLKSRVSKLWFADSGEKLIVGYESGKVTVVDMVSISVLFCIDCVSSPVMFSAAKLPNELGQMDPTKCDREMLLILTRDTNIFMIDVCSGNIITSSPILSRKGSTAISLFCIDNMSSYLGDSMAKKSSQQYGGRTTGGQENLPISETIHSSSNLSDSLLLLCCEDVVHLYSLESLIKGDMVPVCERKLGNACWWSSILKKDEKIYEVMLLYENGVAELRSFPKLDLIGETSLFSNLRWNFKKNMLKNMASSDDGLITVANGGELSFLSLSSIHSIFRTSDFFPCLHDKILAVAADVAVSYSADQTRMQNANLGILDIFKGFKGENPQNAMPSLQKLDDILSKNPFSCERVTTIDEMELDIDDIEIDDPLPTTSTSSHVDETDNRVKRNDREELLHGGTNPKRRTHEEIIAQYKFGGDVSAAAAHAKEKLAQRQEKLERIREKTEELQSGAEDFASMANELAKTLEGRKWWKF